MNEENKNTNVEIKESKPHLNESILRNVIFNSNFKSFGKNDLFINEPTPKQVIEEYNEKARQKYSEEILSENDNTKESPITDPIHPIPVLFPRYT